MVLGQLPYAIALDWKRQNVVLTCRGTSSLRDAVTDAIGQPIDLRLWLSNEHGEPPVSLCTPLWCLHGLLLMRACTGLIPAAARCQAVLGFQMDALQACAGCHMSGDLSSQQCQQSESAKHKVWQLNVLCKGPSSFCIIMPMSARQGVGCHAELQASADQQRLLHVQDEVKGLGPQLAHAGVLTAAAAVYKDLQRHGILEQLLQGSDLPPLPQQTSSQHQPDAGRQGSASQHAKSRPADGQAGPQGSGTASNGGGSSSASSSAGSPPSQPHAASLQDSEARASSGEQGEVPSSAEGASGSHGRLHGSIDERHHAIAETVQEGKDMVARLVQDSNQAGGPQQAGPEARAEEERQLGSLRARKLDCQVRPGREAPPEGCMR